MNPWTTGQVSGASPTARKVGKAKATGQVSGTRMTDLTMGKAKATGQVRRVERNSLIRLRQVQTWGSILQYKKYGQILALYSELLADYSERNDKTKKMYSLCVCVYLSDCMGVNCT